MSALIGSCLVTHKLQPSRGTKGNGRLRWKGSCRKTHSNVSRYWHRKPLACLCQPVAGNRFHNQIRSVGRSAQPGTSRHPECGIYNDGIKAGAGGDRPHKLPHRHHVHVPRDSRFYQDQAPGFNRNQAGRACCLELLNTGIFWWPCLQDRPPDGAVNGYNNSEAPGELIRNTP
jgi:hypothetical protein